MSASEQASEAMVSLPDLAQMFGLSPSTVRNRLKKLKDIPGAYARGTGTIPDRYRRLEACEILTVSRPFALRAFQRAVLGVGLTTPRSPGDGKYVEIVRQQLRLDTCLYIRAITGSIIFEHETGLPKELAGRAAATKLLLLDPTCTAAKNRAKAAQPTVVYHKSLLWTRALRTFECLRELTNDHGSIEAKWVDEVPYNFLVWTAVVALIEAYDYGPPQEPHRKTMSANAPLMLVTPACGAKYHESLRVGFEREFEGEIEHVKTCSIQEIEDRIKQEGH